MGYNVDIIIRYNNINSMEKFEPKDLIRIFHSILINLEKYNFNKNLDYIIILYYIQHTKITKKILLYKSLGFFSNPKSLFIVHV